MLTSGSLVALRNVVRLKLNNNEIERILDGAFELTPSLQNLHLSGRCISSSSCCCSLVVVVVVAVSYTHLTLPTILRV